MIDHRFLPSESWTHLHFLIILEIISLHLATHSRISTIILIKLTVLKIIYISLKNMVYVATMCTSYIVKDNLWVEIFGYIKNSLA